MEGSDHLAQQFEDHRGRLRAVAYRMLGSRAEADDALQEAWLRLNRADASGIDNPGGWLTTVVARVCLDMLRSRRARREEPLGPHVPEPIVSLEDRLQPEHEALLADSVGLALLVVLETLTPAERLAFVLHDMFSVPFDEIAPIVDRSPAAARQLASRARRRVRGGAPPPDPDVVFRIDRGALPAPPSREVRGAHAVAEQVLRYGRPFAPLGRPAIVNGAAGAVVEVRGRRVAVAGFTVVDGRIAAIDLLADPARLDDAGLD